LSDQIIEEPALADDPKYATNQSRVKNRDELLAIINKRLAAKKKAYWLEEFHKSGVPCEPVNNIDDVMSDEQIKAREMVIEMNHTLSGPIKLVGSPMKLSETPVR